ncbi:hypothetical protein BAJUN_02300 [Bajunvirus bajun]|uniref:Uncharacterized protein n=1 Tax=Brevundimonas phage vB_BgoS-Bajun TaxID=2948594 RepID=A0A9E7N6H0_9CAUD|nr:hypothetical protein BAJUN_02300 [Brevundimonas phage vB_BgoS-Bajun]
MARRIDITADVNTDVEAHRIMRLRAVGPYPEEGEFCGLLFAGERGSEGYVPVSITVQGADDATQLKMGAGVYSDGAVLITENTKVNVAIDLINEKLLEVSQQEPPATDGFHLVLGDVVADGDGTWAGGAVMLTDDMPISEGIDRLNEVLGRLVPAGPPAFPNGSLTISNTSGSQARLAAGYTDNDLAGTVLPGTAVTRVTAAFVNSNTFNDVGPGDTGTIGVSLNGALAVSIALDGTDVGTYSGLNILDQKDFPVGTPGFWKSLDVLLSGFAVPVGLNAVQIAHTGGGATNTVVVMRDPMTSNPAISAGSVVQAVGGPGTVAYSSGVPHYGADAYLTVGMSISNLAGETYYGGGDPIQFSGPVISTKTIGYAAADIDAPIARNTLAPVAIEPQTISVDGTGHLSGKISGTARNVNGSATQDLGGPTILIKRGSAGARIDETSVPGPAVTAVRKGQAAGPTPAGVPAAWTQNTVPATHEATVVAGVLAHDQTNYSTGYLPAGPDLSAGRAGAQYVTFSFSRAALSAFKINVTGSYADCRIRLPGASDLAPNAPNGWWNAFKPYDGAGVPGEQGDADAGCALGSPMNGASGTFNITFGTQSSTNATGNEILIRFRLDAGQSISALSFSN